jgi:hypothetical protein
VSNVGRSAVLVTALFFVSPSNATADPPQHTLPAGSTVVFVSDGHLDAGAKPGSYAKVHLRDDLHVDGYLVAAAGTPARITFEGPTTIAGKRAAIISLSQFMTKPGLLPVRPRVGTLEAIVVGEQIEATTLAAVNDAGGRLSIQMAFPFHLSTDAPFSMYTPSPAKTALPLDDHHARGPSRRPTPRTNPSPTAAVTASPSAMPTKIPS